MKDVVPSDDETARSFDQELDAKLEYKMQKILDDLNLALQVSWVPDETKQIHGEIKNSFLFIYDVLESEVWDTFSHEVCEFKLQSVTRPYRLLINSLIEVFEKCVYSEKERFIEFLPKMMEITNEERRKSLVHRKNNKSEKNAS